MAITRHYATFRDLLVDSDRRPNLPALRRDLNLKPISKISIKDDYLPHIVNENSTIQSEGLPFVFESFTLLDTAKDLREVIERGWNAPVPPKPEKRQREMPLENEVVKFD